MPNNTDTYWEADGVSLHTFAWSIETLGGMGPPSLRGDDVTVPYNPGRRWVPKTFDSNVLTLAMQLRGLAADAGEGASQATRQLYQERWNDLIRLLWTPGRQVALRKRFYDTGGVIRVATAMAEYAGGLQPSLIGRAAARCTVDMRIAGGVFYDDTAQVFNLVNGDQTINVRGNSPTRNILVTVNGARNNAKVRVKSGPLDHTVEYHHSLASGDYATLDVMDRTSETVGEGPTYESTLDVRHSGAPYWLELRPGDNVVNLASDSGIGSVQLTVRGAWV